MTVWHMRITGLALCLTAAAATGQTVNAPQSNPSLTATANGIRDEKHARDITMRKLDVSVELRGAVAETTVTASFSSKSPQPLEGEFKLQLPADAVITGYALDIGGRMTDGVLVDRPKAQAVYEARVRRNVDPGLATVSAGNVFSTRVFPITPQAGRTIRVKYVSAVDARGIITVPLTARPPIEGWSIVIRSLGPVAPDALVPGGEATFKPVPGGFEARYTGQSELNPDFATVAVRPAASEDAVLSRHHNGERFVQLGGKLSAAGAVKPERLRIYWDRSRSRLDDRIDDEIALVRDYIAAARPQSIELVAFNSSGAKRVTVADGAAAAAWLKTLTYRGATSFASIASDGDADRCLLFSDGVATIDRATKFAPRCRADAVTSASDADRAWLAHFATAHGGTSVMLDAGKRDAALASLRSGGSGVLSVMGDDGADLPFVPIAAPAGEWRVLARAPASGAVSVWLADGSKIRRTIAGEEVAFDGEGALIARDELALLGATEKRPDFVAMSRRYGIASPSLSFVVLETPQDYVTADVAPPASYAPDDMAKYAELRRNDDKRKDDQRQRRLGDVVAAWREEVAWWGRSFDPNAQRKGERAQKSEPGAPPPPPPPPMMAPPAPAPETMAAPPADADIAVTADRAASGVINGYANADGVRDKAPLAERAGKIEIDAWQPDRPYLKAFDGAPGNFNAIFAAEEKKSGSIPAFYLDTAEWLRKHGRTDDAIEMVLAALDLPTANEVTLGIVADRLERYGAIDRAVELRERHAALDPDRPQPKRYLALALAHRAQLKPAGAREDYTRAIALLRDVALTPWPTAWDGIELVSLVEANAMIPKLRKLGGTPDIDPRLIRLLDTDLRVTIDWTTDATDLDLWVDEPNGERSIYSNQLTAIGGQLSNDMTNGYGPEQYLLRRAPDGVFTVRANVFASDQLDPNGASVLTAHLYRNYGRPDQSEQVVDIELIRTASGGGNKEPRMVGRITVGRK